MNEATKEQLADEKNSDGKKTKLQQEIIEQKKGLESQIANHRESELALRKVSMDLFSFIVRSIKWNIITINTFLEKV